MKLRKENWADHVGLGCSQHMADTAVGLEERAQEKQVQRKGSIREDAKEHWHLGDRQRKGSHNEA